MYKSGKSLAVLTAALAIAASASEFADDRVELLVSAEPIQTLKTLVETKTEDAKVAGTSRKGSPCKGCKRTIQTYKLDETLLETAEAPIPAAKWLFGKVTDNRSIEFRQAPWLNGQTRVKVSDNGTQNLAGSRGSLQYRFSKVTAV